MIGKAILPAVLGIGLALGCLKVYASLQHNSLSAENMIENIQQPKKGVWIGAWAAAQLAPQTHGISQTGFQNQTVRMVIHPTASGSTLRLRISNLYGTQPLTFGRVHVALAGEGGNTVQGTDRKMTFRKKISITIQPGKEAFTDPFSFVMKEGENIAVSVYVPGNSGPTTWHMRSNETTYSAAGDQTAVSNGHVFTNKSTSWFWLSGLDVVTTDKTARVIVTIGDSITDGARSTLNANHRYSDFLAKRLKDQYHDKVSVLNQGISGNQILLDSPVNGIKALDRFEHDVLEQTGVTDIILLEGINDIGRHPHNDNADQIIAGMKEMADRAHAKGLRIYAGTLTPYRGTTIPDFFTEDGEITREKVNKWIRATNVFDGVIDFDKALGNPKVPQRMHPAYDSGDHLHPADAGYQAMADAVNLAWFKP